MDKKILALFDKLSHDNVITFHISPEKNADLIPSKEEEAVVAEFLNSHYFDEACFKKVFSEDVFVATAISIYFFKIGADKERKPSMRFPFLMALSKIVGSLYNANAISEKAYAVTMSSVVDELFVASFGRIFKDFDEVHELFFDGDELEERDDEEIEILLSEYVNQDFAFENLVELSVEMEKADYLLFSKKTPEEQKELSRFVKHFMKKAYSLLKEKFATIQQDMNRIEAEIAADLEDEIDLSPEYLRKSLLSVLDFGAKFKLVARIILQTMWTITDVDDQIEMVEFFDQANRLFDNASGHLSVAAGHYGFEYSYDINFRVESKYYKLYSHAYLGNFIGLEEKAPFANKEDEIRAISLALLRLTSDAMDKSYNVATKISRYVVTGKMFMEYHFAYIEHDIDKKNQAYLNKTLDYLYKFQGQYNFEKTLACCSLFKEILLEDALQNKNYPLAKTAVYARYSSFFDIPTLYIVRKHSNNAYLSLLKKMPLCGKNSHIQTLRENDNMQRFYGSEFCDELRELCLRKGSDA